MVTLSVQTTQSDISKRQPSVATVTDLVSQLAALAEEGALSEAELSANQMGPQLQELSDRLATRKLVLKVRWPPTRGPPRCKVAPS